MGKDMAIDAVLIKKTDTAELRLRFDSIMGLLEQGFNHKQICASINSQGLQIPYAQYRAIMARLRRERLAVPSIALAARHTLAAIPQAVPSAQTKSASHLRLDMASEITHREPPAQDRPLVWDLNSEVKWK